MNNIMHVAFFSCMLYIHVQSILADPVAHKRILTSYELMLDFYGMKLKDPKTGGFTTLYRYYN